MSNVHLDHVAGELAEAVVKSVRHGGLGARVHDDGGAAIQLKREFVRVLRGQPRPDADARLRELAEDAVDAILHVGLKRKRNSNQFEDSEAMRALWHDAAHRLMRERLAASPDPLESVSHDGRLVLATMRELRSASLAAPIGAVNAYGPREVQSVIQAIQLAGYEIVKAP